MAKERVLEINPKAEVEIFQEFFMPNTDGILDKSIDYIVDCIDTVTAKIELVVRANTLNIPIISCMGTGNKLDPTKFEVTDIFKTSVCPLAKVMRKELRARNIKSLKVVYSKEEPIKIQQESDSSCKTNCICPPGTKRKCTIRNQVPGSISFVPSVAGLIIAGEVTKDIIFQRGRSFLKIFIGFQRGRSFVKKTLVRAIFGLLFKKGILKTNKNQD